MNKRFIPFMDYWRDDCRFIPFGIYFHPDGNVATSFRSSLHPRDSAMFSGKCEKKIRTILNDYIEYESSG